VICNNVLINENSTVKDCQVGESLSMPEGCKYSINTVKRGGGGGGATNASPLTSRHCETGTIIFAYNELMSCAVDEPCILLTSVGTSNSMT
jgi:hypothetical protein